MKKTGLFLLFWVSIFLFSGIIQADDVSLQTDERGRIAYVGEDNNIYTLNPVTNSQVQMTDDAGETRRYQWPTWSTDGRLAYFSLYLNEGQIFMGAYVAEQGSDTGSLVYTGENELFNYAYWSPQNCGSGENCRDLAMLISSETEGMFVELLRDNGEELTSDTVGLGGPPFYYSWSPDGSRMLWQRGNSTFDVYDAATDAVIDTLPQTPGAILAPAWSPVDDRLLFGAQGDEVGLTDLVIVGQGDEVQKLASGLEGLVSFSWSPDGNFVAYRVATRESFGPVFIVDAVTGETVARSPVNGVFAFFWAPDSQHIAYITLATSSGSFSASAQSGSHLASLARQQEPNGLAWSILDIESENVNRYGAFIPTEQMIYILSYFDQFAQSHRIWSPDSRHLLYSEMTAEGPVINLLDATQADSVPFSVAQGFIGVWSFA
jgi:TolB protein